MLKFSLVFGVILIIAGLFFLLLAYLLCRGRVISVHNVPELLSAMMESKSGDIILISPGTYDFGKYPYVLCPGVTLKGTIDSTIISKTNP